MQNSSQSRQSELAWGSVANIIDKIGDIEETIDGGWDELINMLADAMTEEGTTKSTATAFCYLFNFVYNLLFRLRSNPSRRPFNIVSKINVDGKEAYRITNYDYKSFKWAKSNDLILNIDNDCLDLSASALTEAQRNAFDKRC